MKDKYNLTIEQNKFLAKKFLVESIYHSAKLEGCNITYPNTQTILDGVSVGNLKMSDVEVVLNLRDAWKYLLENVEQPMTIDFMCKINGYVSRNESLEWGVLRYGGVGISGTEYVPPIPKRETVEKELKQILEEPSVTARAIKLFLWACRSQLFWDGNKRTSTLCANKILIAEGKGILSIKEKDLNEFNTRLSKFYDTNDYSVIDKFLYENCIKGIEFEIENNLDEEDELEQ